MNLRTVFFLALAFVGIIDAKVSKYMSSSPQYNYKNVRYIAEYKQAISGNKPTVIMYSAPWCSACSIMKPAFDIVAGVHKGLINFFIVNTDERKLNALVKKHNITGLPTIIFSRNGKELHRERGGMTEVEFRKSVQDFVGKVEAQKKEEQKLMERNIKIVKDQKKIAVQLETKTIPVKRMGFFDWLASWFW